MPVNFSNITTTDNRKYKENNIAKINKAFKDLPLEQRAILLANIIEESGGDPFIKSKGDTYQGLLQWEADRYRPKTASEDEELQNQIDYIKATLNNTTDRVSWTHGGDGSGYNSNKEPYNTFYNASAPFDSRFRAFSYGYVRPEGKEDSYSNRLKVGKEILNRLRVGEVSPPEPYELPIYKFNTPSKFPSKYADGGKLNNWDSLSLAEKAEVIKVGVSNGLTNIQDIKQKYNEFAGGGNTEGNNTSNNTEVTPEWYKSLDKAVTFVKDNITEPTFNALDVAVETIEPYVSGAQLATGALTLASDGAASPLYIASNVAGAGIDGYQTIRNGYKAITDDNVESIFDSPYLYEAGKNGLETVLDVFGAKGIKTINKPLTASVSSSKKVKSVRDTQRVGTGAGRVIAKKIAKKNTHYNIAREKALEESEEYLAKRGVHPWQGDRYFQYLTEEMQKRGFGIGMTKAINSAEKVKKQNDVASYILNSSVNSQNLKPLWQVSNQHAYGGNLFEKGGSKSKKQTKPNNSQRAMDYLMSKGINPIGASAIVGVLQAESSLDPTIHAQMKGDSGEGLAQWTGSRKKQFWSTLERIEPGAKKKYGTIDKVPFERQLDVVLHERPDVTNAINNSKDLVTATDIMVRGYENGGGGVHNMASTKQMDNVYGKWGNGYNNQMAKRLGNASKILGIDGYINPVTTFFEDNINLPSFSNTIDPSTTYKAPTLDATLFETPLASIPTTKTNVVEDNTSSMQRLTNAMQALGLESPFNVDNPLMAIANAYSNQYAGGGHTITVGSDEYNANVAKQKELNNAGYKVKVDGSWGPYQQGLYTKIKLSGMKNATNSSVESVDNTRVYTPNIPQRSINPHLKVNAEKGAQSNAIWEKEHPNMTAWRNTIESIPFAVAATPVIAGGAEVLAGTALGNGITSALGTIANTAKGSTWLPWADAALTSAFGAKGISDISKGEFTPETALDLLPLGQTTAFTLYPQLVDKYPIVEQYPRFLMGKFKYGFDAELPTLYRKIKTSPIIENGKVLITTPRNRFASVSTGKETPIITNFTTDVPVRSHSSNWDSADVLAIPGKELLGKHVISTRPSDTFTFGDNIKLKPKKISYISGDEQLLGEMSNYGMDTYTSKQAIDAFKTNNTTPTFGIDLKKDDFSEYNKALTDIVKSRFKAPTLNDYQFMDYVLQPRYKSEVFPYINLSNVNMDELETLPNVLADGLFNTTKRNYLTNPEEWRNVIYDPTTYAEFYFRNASGIDLKHKIPLNVLNNGRNNSSKN